MLRKWFGAAIIAALAFAPMAHADPMGFDGYFGTGLGTSPWRGPLKWEGRPGVGCKVTHFTVAQALTLNTTPVTIFPTPGAGNEYIVVSDTAVSNFVSAAYTDTGATGLYYGTSAGTLASTGLHLAGLAASALSKQGVLTANASVAVTATANLALVATGTANMAAGNSPLVETTCVVVVPVS